MQETVTADVHKLALQLGAHECKKSGMQSRSVSLGSDFRAVQRCVDRVDLEKEYEMIFRESLVAKYLCRYSRE